MKNQIVVYFAYSHHFEIYLPNKITSLLFFLLHL